MATNKPCTCVHQPSDHNYEGCEIHLCCCMATVSPEALARYEACVANAQKKLAASMTNWQDQSKPDYTTQAMIAHGEYVHATCQPCAICDASKPDVASQRDCCGDAHADLEFAMHCIAELGFEEERKADGKITEIIWHNRRGEAAERQLAERKEFDRTHRCITCSGLLNVAGDCGWCHQRQRLTEALRYPRFGTVAELLRKAGEHIDHCHKNSNAHYIYRHHLDNAAKIIDEALGLGERK